MRADFAGSLISTLEILVSRLGRPSRKLHYESALIRAHSNDRDLIIPPLLGNFSPLSPRPFFSVRPSAVEPNFGHPHGFQKETECRRGLSLACLGKSRLFEVPRKVELGGSPAADGKTTRAFSAEDRVADYLPLCRGNETRTGLGASSARTAGEISRIHVGRSISTGISRYAEGRRSDARTSAIQRAI